MFIERYQRLRCACHWLPSSAANAAVQGHRQIIKRAILACPDYPFSSFNVNPPMAKRQAIGRRRLFILVQQRNTENLPIK
jgi:hypothetical protein